MKAHISVRLVALFPSQLFHPVKAWRPYFAFGPPSNLSVPWMVRFRSLHPCMAMIFSVVAISLAKFIVPCIAGSSSSHYDNVVVIPALATVGQVEVVGRSVGNDINGKLDKDGPTSNHNSSWWHAPFLINRRPKRKLTNKLVINKDKGGERQLSSEADDDSDIAMHRFLAFGDYVDPTYSCPATTTCPVVCVAAVEDCPEDAVCPGDEGEYELCADGTCADLAAGQCDPEAESPCSCKALPFTCAKQVDLYTNCFTRFQVQYDYIAECDESKPQVNFWGPWFIACYAGLAAVTVIMLMWCAWNQRWASVSGSTVPLECVKVNQNVGGSATMGAMKRSLMKDEEEAVEKTAVIASQQLSASVTNEQWTQTGYKYTIIGMIFYSLVVLAHVVIQFLLFALTVEYYVQQEAITTSIFGSQVFYDEIQVLMAFEITWMLGFVWCFFLKYPASIHSLFLRRCVPEDANYVAVTAPIQTVDAHYKNKLIVKLLSSGGTAFRMVLSFLYSDKSQHPVQGMHNKVTFCKVRVDAKTGSRYFYFHMRRYILDATSNIFIPGSWNVSQDTTIGQWLDTSYLHQGLSEVEASKRLGIVGPNVLDLKKPTILSSIANEFSKPFYLYQNFMVWTWAPFWYYYMAIVHSIVRVTGGLVVAVFQYSSNKDLYQLMVTEGTVEVLRGGVMMIMEQTDVVPGDIIRLVPGIAYFDMAILQANTLLVDESSLTGEVHPIAKTPLDPANSELTYDVKANKSSTISAGATILECGDGPGTEGDLAIVTKTGSFTAKGELLSDVLSYERHKFKFDTEVHLVLAILAVEALILVAIVLNVIEDNWVYSWFYAMFVVGTVLPPLLPTVFVVSVGISCKRLQGMRITCTDSRGILVAGKVKKAFFDKTGTLTMQGLEFLDSHSGDMTEKESSLLKRGLAVCQTLHLSNDGGLVGPAVDRIGFAASSAKMLDQNTISFEGGNIEYLKRFEFDHHRMTQSVIIKHGEDTIVYVKGSPEAISKLCVQSSLPSDFSEKARQSARDGIYQLAMAMSAYKSTNAMNEVKREDIETGLKFVGFINFQNSMKKNSPAVIEELRRGNVNSAMITGDNVLTGIHIAMQVGIIEHGRAVVIGNSIQSNGQVEWVNASDDSPAVPHEDASLALTGEVWEHLLKSDPKSALEYAKRTGVFGRCTPNDKVSIVSTFVEIGDIVLMCGDGGNDCGALKAAHVGIALSDAEASVVAPFTSLDKSITSVTQVLKEGRCALASAFASYKYMIMYGQVESINQVVNAYFSITFTEWCWVFMDGLWTITMAFSLPLAKAASKLSPLRPTASILGPYTLSSACGILAINFLFLVFALLALGRQDWYQCRKWDSDDVSNVLTIGDNYETSVIFIVSGFQYMSTAAAYNFGYSFRANWFRNYVFLFFFSLWTAFQFAATLSYTNFSCIWRLNCDNDHVVRSVTSTEPEAINNNFNTTVMPLEFRGILVELMLANLILNCAWDYFVVNMALRKCGSEMLGTADDSQHVGVKYEAPSLPLIE